MCPQVLLVKTPIFNIPFCGRIFENGSFNLLAIMIYLLQDYFNYGLYSNNKDILETTRTVTGVTEVMTGESMLLK